MQFDDILEVIGEFGPYQKRVFYLLTLPIAIGGIQMYSLIFTFDIPAYRCAIPGYSNDTYAVQNVAHARIINETIPPGEAGHFYSKCQTYAVTNTSFLASTLNGSTRHSDTCNRWVYDTSDYTDTAVTEYNLVCDRALLWSHANMLTFAGALFGAVTLGPLADMWGRKKVIMIALILSIISCVGTYFAASFLFILVLKFIGGVANQTLFSSVASTGIELVGPSKRSFAGVFEEWYFSAGTFLLLLIVYLVREWRLLHLIMGVLLVPLLSLWWLVPESPRWLLDKGRYDEVESILERICKSNNTKLPPEALKGAETEEKEPQMNILAMFTNKILALRCLNIFFIWFSANLLYYGLTLNMVNLEGSPYLNFAIAAIVEALAYAVCMFTIDRVGRRVFLCFFTLVGSVACMAVIPTLFISEIDYAWIRTGLSLLGKFCSSCCYTVLYIMSAELFPTVVRSSGIGICSVFENTAGMCSPYIADLGNVIGGVMGQGAPMIVFGGFGFVAGLTSLLLPETLHKQLPETVEDAIQFGRKNPLTDKTKNKDSQDANQVNSKYDIQMTNVTKF